MDESLKAEYNKIKEKLAQDECLVNPYREIQYGIQFLVFNKDKKSGLVRLFKSKKGLRSDLSQVDDPKLKKQIASLLSIPDEPKIIPFRYDKSTSALPELQKLEEIIGIDESGKGDYFGPLVVAGVHMTPKTKRELQKLGVMDSKELSDEYMEEIAPQIKALCAHSLVIMGNQSYNDIYAKMNNLNHILAWGHARVLENILNQVSCPYALSDQFGNPALIKNALMTKGREIQLFQQPKAESHLAVAAASILARTAFVTTLRKMEAAFEMKLPKGCSIETRRAAQNFVDRYGIDNLPLVAKLHFKLTQDIQVPDKPTA